MGRSVLSPPVANIPDFDAKLLSDLAGRLAAVTPMVHYRTLKLFGITFPRFAPFGATVLVHNSLVSDPRNHVQFFGGRAVWTRFARPYSSFSRSPCYRAVYGARKGNW